MKKFTPPCTQGLEASVFWENHDFLLQHPEGFEERLSRVLSLPHPVSAVPEGGGGLLHPGVCLLGDSGLAVAHEQDAWTCLRGVGGASNVAVLFCERQPRADGSLEALVAEGRALELDIKRGASKDKRGVQSSLPGVCRFVRDCLRPQGHQHQQQLVVIACQKGFFLSSLFLFLGLAAKGGAVHTHTHTRARSSFLSISLSLSHTISRRLTHRLPPFPGNARSVAVALGVLLALQPEEELGERLVLPSFPQDEGRLRVLQAHWDTVGKRRLRHFLVWMEKFLPHASPSRDSIKQVRP